MEQGNIIFNLKQKDYKGKLVAIESMEPLENNDD